MALLLRRTALFFAIVLASRSGRGCARGRPRGRLVAGYAARHHRGQDPRAPALLRARQRPRAALPGRRRPHRHAVAGSAHIEGKYVRPAWAPPPMIRAREPASARGHSGRRAATIRWARPRSRCAAANTPSTAPTVPARSAASSRTAASACTTATSATLYAMVSVGTPVVVESPGQQQSARARHVPRASELRVLQY